MQGVPIEGPPRSFLQHHPCDHRACKWVGRLPHVYGRQAARLWQKSAHGFILSASETPSIDRDECKGKVGGRKAQVREIPTPSRLRSMARPTMMPRKTSLLTLMITAPRLRPGLR